MPASFTIRQLEYFDAVASSGSLTAASERCLVTPSALTLAIDDLERRLGVQLLIRRKGRGVTLTSAGTRMLSHVREVLGRVEALASEASRESGSVSGPFSIGCFTTLTPFFVPPVIDKFQRDFPQVDLVVRTASADGLYEQLVQGRIDVALLYSVDVPHPLVFDPVLTYRPHVLVPTDHRLSGRSAVSLGELISEPLIMLDVPPTLQNTRAIFDQLSLSPQVGHVTTSYEAARCLVGYGLGYAVMFQRPATDVTYDGHPLRALDIVDRVPPTVLGLARPAGAARTARYEVLRAFLARGRVGGEPVDPDRLER